ncbi:MAG: hypothetical protein V3V08_05340 [Nannocystaceae bacterium]
MECIDAYKEPPQGEGEWLPCAKCGLLPLVWEFNNGLSTACGCANSRYAHRSIHAESVMSVYKRTGCTAEYDSDALRENWNHWVRTGEDRFPKPREDGKW